MNSLRSLLMCKKTNQFCYSNFSKMYFTLNAKIIKFKYFIIIIINNNDSFYLFSPHTGFILFSKDV